MLHSIERSEYPRGTLCECFDSAFSRLTGAPPAPDLARRLQFTPTGPQSQLAIQGPLPYFVIGSVDNLEILMYSIRTRNPPSRTLSRVFMETDVWRCP